MQHKDALLNFHWTEHFSNIDGWGDVQVNAGSYASVMMWGLVNRRVQAKP